MTPERWAKIEGLFQAAVARPLEERAAFLEKACDGDDSLRREVDALLASDRAEDDVLDEIASGTAASWAAESDGRDLAGKTIGRYQILAPLGFGGMGEVFLAQDDVLDRKVALKLLPKQFTQDRDRLRRFEQEARAASALNHPNIITIYEIGESDGTRFMAAEYVEGQTLRELIGKPERQLADVLEIGIQASGALAAAHGANIIHRDIKPANIMLRRDGYIKVLDFGLAKLTSARAHLDVTEPGRVMGTINYMSPEQAMGQALDHRTDVFSLGVVLYELATGQRLFEGKSDAAVYDSILHKETPPLRQFAPASPIELDQVIRRALEKDPARRYQTAADLRADLKRLSEGAGKTRAAVIAARERSTEFRGRLLRYAATISLVAAVIVGALFVGKKFAPQTGTPPESPRKSIAVLPFSNLSSSGDNAYFVDGMHDQVLTDLAKIAQLKVIGRSSVSQYQADTARDLRQIGEQLGAAYLLEGSVQRAGGRVRVNARLIQANQNEQVWAETYDRELADVFDIQSDIAKAIAAQLRTRLSPAETAEIERKPSSNLRAFELYTQARSLLELAGSTVEGSEQSARTAINLLEQAIQRDPGFAAAYRELTRAHDFLYWTGVDHSEARLALGQAAVEAAARAAPGSADTHLALIEHAYAKRDFETAERELAAAQSKLPNDSRATALAGYIHRRLGRWEESTRDLEKAMELDPRNVNVLNNLAINYLTLENDTAGLRALERIIEIDSEHLGARLGLASLEIARHGDTRPLRNLLEAISREEPANAKKIISHKITLAFYERDFDAIASALELLGDGWYGSDYAKFSREFGEGLLARMKGDAAATQERFSAARLRQERTMKEQPDYPPALSILGLIDAGLGRNEDALRAGRRAAELLPATKDSINGPPMIDHLAIIAAWVGETDLAIEQLRRRTQAPPRLRYGELLLNPMWDPLRSDPRFQAILASLAPAGAR
jgi:serine/threonine protein kinase/Flp pilus assembly protein TadD